jgi:hypothetical protein
MLRVLDWSSTPPVLQSRFSYLAQDRAALARHGQHFSRVHWAPLLNETRA